MDHLLLDLGEFGYPVGIRLDLVRSFWILLDMVEYGWIWLDHLLSGWIWLDLVGSDI